MEELNEKEYYKEAIIDIINSIDREDILVYFYYLIKGKLKAE